MHARRLVVAVVALCVFFVALWKLPDAAASEKALGPAKPLAEMAIGASHVDWQPAGHYEQIALTVAGPEGVWFRKEFAAGQPPSLGLVDQDGNQLPDGTYVYELRFLPSSAQGLQRRATLQTGSFAIRNGGFAAMFEEPQANEPRARKTQTAPEVNHDKVLTTSNECIGPNCAAGDDAFPILRLKGQYNVGILFDDVFDGFSYDRNWMLQANPSLGGPDHFFLWDLDAGTTPFSVFGNSPSYSLVVGTGGKIGLGTTIPGAPLHLYGNATSDAFMGMGPDPASGPALNLGYGGASFGRSAAFLNVRPDASATAPNPSLRFLTGNVERMIVTNTGDVGLGISSPSSQLHVRDTTGSRGKILAENASGTAASREMLEIRNNGTTAFILNDTSVPERWAITASGSTLYINNQANAGIENIFSPTGNLTIAGTLTQGSDRATKRDVVPVRPEEVLAKVMTLPVSTWNRKTDDPAVRHMGPMAQDFAATFGLGDDDRHIAILDLAGVSLASIQALSYQVMEVSAQKDEEIAQLQRENADLAQRLATLEALVLQARGEKSAETILKSAP